MGEIELEKKWNASDETAKTVGVRSSLALSSRLNLQYSRTHRIRQTAYADYRLRLQDLMGWMAQCYCFRVEDLLDYLKEVENLSPKYTIHSHRRLLKIHDILLINLNKSGILYHKPQTMESNKAMSAGQR